MREKQLLSLKILITLLTVVIIFSGGMNEASANANRMSISGEISLYEGTADLSEATVQLTKDGAEVGEPVHPSADGSYNIPSVEPGEDYNITVSLDGYYDETTLQFEVVNQNVTGKDIILQRREPIIVTPTPTTISKGDSGVSLVVELSEISGLENTYEDEEVVTDLSNWEIDTNDTGLTVNRIIRNSDTKVTIDFIGTASKARAIKIQAKPEVINNAQGLASNDINLSVVEDEYITSSNPDLQTYYTKNVDVDGELNGIVVIVHGLAEHLGRYNYTTEKLNQAGYGVYRLDNKGHGKTEKTVINGRAVDGYVEDFNEYLDDPNIIVNMIKEDYPDQKIFMLGHSMGGRIVASYGMKYPDQLDGQLFTGAAVKYQDQFVEYRDSEEQSPFEGEKATEMIPNELADTICRDAAIRAQYSADPLNLNQFANKLLHEYRVELGGYLSDHIEEYEYPALILHGADDRIVPKEFSEWFYEGIASNDKEIKMYPDAYHEILNERKEKYEVFEDMIDWMDERL
ncbi:alpha/beta fold hydrolase [Halanaerobium hydrogeniformans]|uniref:Alpha/beta hydrolase fold protein n=1 Tax=Halanaerobium hydrogeniformans TaxID=656519 RepID=E4RNP9_HALHG|nr:alpha/beta fold hydrolase [Halanaerobium hydrogeniformans]ADQ13727.1 alpha/beta hydrolase fold protein [Halanaerobium hydrogeniformans]